MATARKTEQRADAGAGAEQGTRWALRTGLRLDLDTASRAFPGGRVIVPVVALAIAVGIGWLRPGYFSIYSESLAVIVVLVALGSFGRTIGAMAIVAFAMTDVAHFVLIPDNTIGAQLSRDTLIGRVVTEGVLWLVVIVVPSTGRRMERFVEGRFRDGLATRIAGGIVGAVVAGVGTYLWANVMPYLIRPAFKYSPRPFTLQPQQHPETLALAVAAAYLLVTLLVRRRAVDRVEVAPMLRLPASGVGGLIARAVGYAVLIGLVSGIISGPLDLVVLAAGFVVGEVGAMAAGRPAIPRPLVLLPAWLITGAGFVLTAVLAVVVGKIGGDAWPRGFADSIFFPIVLAVAVSYPVARTAFSVGAHRGSLPSIPSGVKAVGGIGTVVVLALAFPRVTLADNCSNLGDCYYQALYVATLLGFGALFGALAGAFTSAPQQNGPPPDVPTPPPLVPADPDEWWGHNPRQQADEANWGPGNYNRGGPCVLTSTCVTALGKPDDCHELEMFRRLRDQYLLLTEKGRAVIDDYYRSSPHVVAAIEAGPVPAAVWPRIYDDLVAPVVELLDAGRPGEAATRYLARYEALKVRYGVR